MRRLSASPLLLISGYFLWSNSRTYSAAENTFQELHQLKPELTDDTFEFDKLRLANPDVCGWLSVDGTKIDYPILQGRDNLYYMSKDYFGAPSLAGSIFIDARNNRNFSDSYSIIYGHHVDNHLMFGDLDLFKDDAFFNANDSVTIITEDRAIGFKILAVMEQPDITPELFDPEHWGSDLSGFGAFVKENAVYVRESALRELSDNPTRTQAVSLVTCTSGQTGTRLVLVLIAPCSDRNPDHSSTDISDISSPDDNPPPMTGDTPENDLLIPIILLGVSMAALLWVMLIDKRTKKES